MSSNTENMEKENRKKEELHHLANLTDKHGDQNKIIEESSMDENSSSFQTVYRPTTVTVKYKKREGLKKYAVSLRHLLPLRVKTGPGSMMPVDQAGCVGFTCYSWLSPLIWRVFRKGVDEKDMYQCSPYDGTRVNGARLYTILDQEMNKDDLKKNFLLSLVLKFIRTRLIVSCLIYLACCLLGLIGPTLFMRWLLEYIQSPEVDHIKGITWTASLIVCEIFRVFCFSLMWAVNIRTSVRINTGIMSLLYRKLILLQVVTAKSIGEYVNNFANDCQKIFLMVYNLPLLIGGPFIIIGSVIYLWWLIGPYCLLSFAVFLFSYFLQYGIARLSGRYRKKVIEITDQRVSLMTEFLNYIKLIKLHAWEKPMTKNITETRSKERSLLEKCQYLQVLNTIISGVSPYIATIITIVAYTLSKNDLRPSEAFTLIAVNFIAAHGIKTLPLSIRDAINGNIAIKRLQKIFLLHDRENYTTLPVNPEHAVYISNATLTWDNEISLTGKDSESNNINLKVIDVENSLKDEVSPNTALVTPVAPTHVLRNISLIIPKGKLIGICGSVGSGKSSLLLSLLGQMKLIHGQVAVRGSCAYVPQQSWILQTSLRENILFGHPFNSKRYYEAIYCCGLTEDVAHLPCGDQTEIGDHGANLSGGQKQRICLARALYADKEVYILDDPLSAVDYLVGRHVFQHCLKGALRGKSILFVTHQVQYLEECDSIILMRNGEISERGTHEELLTSNSEYSVLIQMLSKNKEKLLEENEKSKVELDSPIVDLKNSPLLNNKSFNKCENITSSMSDVADSDAPDGHISEKEPKNMSISLDTYKCYMKAAGGYIVCSLVLIWFLFYAALAAFSNWWLGHWLKQGNGNSSDNQPDIIEVEKDNISLNPQLSFYQLVYGLSAVMLLVIGVILGFLFSKTSLRASSSLHDLALIRIAQSPMHFFDTISVGKILNIFTRDLDEVDTQLPTLIETFLQHLMFIIFSLVVIALVFPWFLIPLLVIAIGFIFLQRIFRAIMRELKHQENISRSPIYSHITATIEGIISIQAFKKQDEFTERFIQLVDANASPLYLFYSSMRWFAIRMNFLCVLIILIVCLFGLFLKEEIAAAFIALAISLTIQMCSFYQYITRLGCDIEARFTSVKRIQSYIEQLELESPAIVDNSRPPVDWPTRGRISFRDVTMRYRPGLPLALKGVTFDIDSQDKIAIVGRTGAGKSSIGVALFRLVEVTSGTIFIDGLDISQFGLEDLRPRISIIPQDPILFRGTVRYNLDPINQHMDMELWDVLEQTHIKDKVMTMDGGLDACLMEGGRNFSVGERQLLCMARALLQHNKIVLLDEATASIDPELDSLIQDTIHEVFNDCTVLTIAHRKSTVMRYNRILVLSDGKVVEFDKTSILASNPNSFFSQLMTDTTLVTEL
ncbi:ATP-binding cassette sub-family C member 12-like isoform X1 [Centruroides vittatus]|uniref:ATP-binding cassette sub-family C member 12-like isoform X1 n=1 Tax=Centruroides vittatus TaxID=120091 RepID=UPI00350E9F8C